MSEDLVIGGERMAVTMSKLLYAMERGGIVNNRSNAVSAFNKVGADEAVGFTLAACCAMLVQESAGTSEWGHDPWYEGMYPKGIALDPAWNLNGKIVTESDYNKYVVRRNEGMQPQGCGVCQLTWGSDQIQADRLGGCWEPYPNMLVGFQILKTNCLRGGNAFQAFWYYNGRTPQGENYAYDAVSIMNRFQTLFNEA